MRDVSMIKTAFPIATPLGLAGAFLFAAGAWSQAADPACTGNSVTIMRGDTLSRIAERCDVTEGALLAANPRVDGSADLQAGATLSLRRESVGSRLGSQLHNFATEANDAMGRVADKVGSSVEDLLDKNPDLKFRLDKLGQTIGLSESPSVADISVTPQSAGRGSTVTVSGTGLPKDTQITIGAGARGSAFEAIAQARTSSSGTLDAQVLVPGWAAPGTAIVFVAKAGDVVQARSGKVMVSP